MDGNVVECDHDDLAERDPGPCGGFRVPLDSCGGCRGLNEEPSLAVLKEVQRAYEERMEIVDRMTGLKKLQTQVELLRSWVSDLVGQNTLLAQAVEELETEATTRLYIERQKHNEMVCELRCEASALRRRLARKDSDMRGLIEVLRRLREFDHVSLDGIHFFERDECAVSGKMTELKILNDSLHKENIGKDREIRKLNKDVQQYEQTILNLRNELSFSKYQAPEVLKKDAEVMAGMCCAANAECGDWRPVKELCEMRQADDVMHYQERIDKMEENLKSSNADVATLRTYNVSLREELRALRSACAALAGEARASAQRDSFKDDIIRELRAQLKRAKAQYGSAPEVSEHSMVRHKSCWKKYRRRPKMHIAIQEPETAAKGAEVHELFFHGRSGRFATSTPKPKCTDESRTLPRCYEDTNESVGRSEADSPSAGSCASARAQYYQNKLMATLQILQNKDETIRVQVESLTVAEARIVALTARTTELKIEVDRKNREIKALRETIKEVEKSEASVWVETQETDSQANIMKTLQNNLSVIEDLYRECFYETAKQEGIIEMLRKSYLDVRLMEKDKSDQITRLNSIINTQKWSLDRCQDIASEVDDLKIEITNFLNSSNNDSGVWEESADGVMEDLQDINAQLLSLRELLTGDCTCGLEQENKRLKHTSKMLEKKVNDLSETVIDLENNLENKETAERKFEDHVENKERELQSLRNRLMALENDSKDCCRTCETSLNQLQQSHVLLEDKSAELVVVQSKCRQYEDALKVVKKEVEKYQECDKEKCKLRDEAKQLRREVHALRTQLLRSQRHSAALQERCRKESRDVDRLESELTTAAQRGAALCTAARRAVHTVRGWAARLRDAHSEQEITIETKDAQLRALRKQLEELKPCPAPRSPRPMPCSPRPVPCPRQPPCASPEPCTKCCSPVTSSRRIDLRYSEEEPSCSRCVTSGHGRAERVHGRSRSTCARRECPDARAASPAPAPPPRALKKRHSCHQFQHIVRDVSIQLPVRRDASCACALAPSALDCRCQVATLDPVMQWSPCEELFSRVEGAGAALASALSRWRKPPTCAGGPTRQATTSSE